MRSLWVYLFPLLFLPNLGVKGGTQYGTLEMSDYLIFPYLLLVVWSLPRRRSLVMNGLIPLLAAFAAWVCIATVSIPVRYPDETHRFIYFGLLKFTKLSIFVTAGVLTAKRLSKPGEVKRFHWALLAAGMVIGVALVKLMGKEEFAGAAGTSEGFKANNVVSVILSVLACYIAGAVVMRIGTPGWRRCAWVALGVMALGSAFSNGRSGWLAGAAAMLYLLYRRGFSRQVAAAVVCGTALLIPTYFLSKTFRTEVDKTIHPDPRYLRRYKSGAFGLDDGGRLHNWIIAAKSFPEAPFWGAGFFHRGGESPLRYSGSHNFFLQIFLETGLVGGLLMLLIFGQMWRHAGLPVARMAGLEVPLKCALVAAIVGGFGGEYFYGGSAALALIAVYGPVGALASGQNRIPAAFPVRRWPGVGALNPSRLGAI